LKLWRSKKPSILPSGVLFLRKLIQNRSLTLSYHLSHRNFEIFEESLEKFQKPSNCPRGVFLRKCNILDLQLVGKKGKFPLQTMKAYGGEKRADLFYFQ
jgi:hypothetical protein